MCKVFGEQFLGGGLFHPLPMKEIELWSNTIWDSGPSLEIILEFWPKGLKHFWLRVGTIFKHCVWRGFVFEICEAVSLVILHKRAWLNLAKRWKRENRNFGIPLTKWVEIIVLEHIVHIWQLQIFSLLMMWQFGPNFLFKKYHFAPPPTPIGEGLELGISFWHTYTPIVKFLLLLLLLLLVWWEPTCSLHPKVGVFQEIFYAAKVTMIPRRGVLCSPLALMEMETSHFRDKYKSWSSCIERESFFPCGWFSCFSSQLRLSTFCGRSWKDAVFHTFHCSGTDVL